MTFPFMLALTNGNTKLSSDTIPFNKTASQKVPVRSVVSLHSTADSLNDKHLLLSITVRTCGSLNDGALASAMWVLCNQCKFQVV